MGLAFVPADSLSFPYFFQIYYMLTGFQTEGRLEGTERCYLRLFLRSSHPAGWAHTVAPPFNLGFLGSIPPMLGEEGERV